MAVKGYTLGLILFVCLLISGVINAEGALIISPLNATVVAGESITYYATDTDTNTDVTGAATFTTNGGGSFALNVFTGTITGTFVITVSYAGTIATTAVTITPDSPISLSISPLNATTTAGAPVIYSATATDSYNNSWNVTGLAAFTATVVRAKDNHGNYWDVSQLATITTTGGGSFTANNRFFGTTTGTYTIQAVYDGKTATAVVVINHATATILSILPRDMTIMAGSNVIYYATATDAYNNKWAVTTVATFTASGGGSFISQHEFKGTMTGTYIIQMSYEDKIATTTITINHATPTTLNIAPATATIIAGGEGVYYLITAADEYGNPWIVTDTATLTTTGESLTANHFTGTTAGTYIITAEYAQQLAFATTTINHAIATLLSIMPINASLTAGGNVVYYATATDEYGNAWVVTDTATITTTGGGTFVSSPHEFMGTRTGTYTISATYEETQATTTVIINHATATDVYGNAWSVTDVATFTAIGGGVFDNLQEFVGTKTGTYTIRVDYGELFNTTTVTINHATTTILSIIPQNTSIIAGQSTVYYTTATDGHGNTWDATGSSTFTTNGGGAFLFNNVLGIIAGTFTITSKYAGLMATTTLNIQHDIPLSIQISPLNSIIMAGNVIAYHATATDLYNNNWDIPASTATVFSSDDPWGTVTGFLYTAGEVGTWTVTGKHGELTDNATVVVVHGTATAIVIEPATTTVAAGDTVVYSVTARDGMGNTWTVTNATAFGSDDPRGTVTGFLYTAGEVGTWTITGGYAGLAASATVGVVRGTATALIITPADTTIEAIGTMSYTATAMDVKGNTWTVTGSTSFTTTDSWGTMSDNGNIYTAGMVGTWTIIGECAGLAGSTTVIVIHGTPTVLVMEPTTIAVAAGDTVKYDITARDIVGNTWTVTGSTTYSTTDPWGTITDNLYTTLKVGDMDSYRRERGFEYQCYGYCETCHSHGIDDRSTGYSYYCWLKCGLLCHSYGYIRQ